MKNLIGLSLSFCIQEICRGEIPLGRVAGIVPGFQFDFYRIPELKERYGPVYWTRYQQRAFDVLDALIASDRILPPHEGGQNIADGHWLRAGDYSPDMPLNYPSENRSDDLKMTAGEARQWLRTPRIPFVDMREVGQVWMTGKHKYGLKCSIIRAKYSYGSDDGLYELGLFTSHTGRTRDNERPFVNTVEGWLSLEQAMDRANEYRNFPAHKLALYKKYRSLSKKATGARQKALMRKANRIAKSIPELPVLH